MKSKQFETIHHAKIWLLLIALIFLLNGKPASTLAQVPVPFKPALAQVPTQSEVEPAHPRLFLNADERVALAVKAATSHQQIWAPILAYADQEVGTPPPAVAPVAGDMETYRNFGNRIIPLAFVCVITQAANRCALAKTYLLTYAAWQQWDEADTRGLGLAHMVMGNAIAYDWLYDKLTSAERATMRTSLGDWAQKLDEASSAAAYNAAWKNWWRKSYMQNHFWTCNSALGMAGLALLHEDERAQGWVDHAANQMQRVQHILNAIGDGSWHESIAYQNYALTMALPFLFNLRQLEGIDLLPQTYLRNYVYWRLYNYLPNNIHPLLTYGDFDWNWGNSYEPQNLLRFIAREYQDGLAEWVSQQLVAADRAAVDVWSSPWYVFEFLYYDPSIVAQAPTQLSTARVFPDQESVIWRTGWDYNALIFGLKSGALGGRFAFDTFVQGVYPWDAPCEQTACQLNVGHDHHDTNGFYLYQAGHWLAPETVGVGKSAAAFHNTLLIDGQDQYGPPNQDFWEVPDDFKHSDSFLAVTAHTPDFDYLAANATGRYQNIDGLQDVTRHVLFVKPNYFLMLDNVASKTAHTYTWVSHFGESVAVEGAWIRGAAGGGQVLGVDIVAPTPFSATTGFDGQPYVHIQPTLAQADARLIHLLYPTTDAAWSSKPSVKLLADTGQAATVRVQRSDGQVDDLIFNYAASGGQRAVAMYRFDGRVAVIRREGQGRLVKLFVQGATALADDSGNRILVMGLNAQESFEAAYQGENVAISGSSSQSIRLYAPDVQRLTVNGTARSFTRAGDYILFCSATRG